MSISAVAHVHYLEVQGVIADLVPNWSEDVLTLREKLKVRSALAMPIVYVKNKRSNTSRSRNASVMRCSTRYFKKVCQLFYDSCSYCCRSTFVFFKSVDKFVDMSYGNVLMSMCFVVNVIVG